MALFTGAIAGGCVGLHGIVGMALGIAAGTVPTLLLFGERDPNVEGQDAVRFFDRLETKEKQIISFPGADHCVLLENTHDAWIAAIANFLNRLAVRLQAPPVEGAANKALAKFLAETLGIRAADVRIVSGEKSRDKVVEISGATEDKIARLLGDA